MNDKIKVLIAEDMEPLRKKYVSILNRRKELTVIADVGTGEEAFRLSRELTPDVILMDIEMETKDAGIRAIGKILSKLPEIRIIILTIYEEDELVFSAFRLGACDYILKNAGEEEITRAVIDAYHNRSAIRPEIAGKLRTEFKRVKTYESSFLLC